MYVIDGQVTRPKPYTKSIAHYPDKGKCSKILNLFIIEDAKSDSSIMK